MDEENQSIEEMNSSDKKDILKKLISVKNLVKLFFILLFLNLIYLDILLIQGVGSKQTIIQRFENITNQVADKTATPDPNICPQSCLSEIRQAAVSNKPNAVTPTLSPTALPLQNTNSSQTKEYYVPFGSGSGSSSDWQDVPGLQASIDSNSYGSIKSVVFEASLHIPTGNETASVRLYNSTDSHPVWNSQVDFTGSAQSVLKTSQAISLDSGNKLYKVQMKTQLQFQAILDQSRLHITTN